MFREPIDEPTPARLRSHEIGREMCDALGLNPNDVIGFTLEVRVGASPNLTVIHQAYDADTETFLRQLKSYKLSPAD